MADNNLSTILSTAAVAVEAAAPLLPGVAGTVARVVGAGLRFGADLAAAGHDPVAAIERIHSATPLLRGVQAHWREQIATRPAAPSAR